MREVNQDTPGYILWICRSSTTADLGRTGELTYGRQKAWASPVQFIFPKGRTDREVMERQRSPGDLRMSLEEILALCLKSVRGIRRALTDPTSHSSSGVEAELYQGTPTPGVN